MQAIDSAGGMRLTDRKRRAILEAAAVTFERDGFDGASMNSIAAAAGASKRTVYKHFSSKEALFQAITLDLLERAEKLTMAPYDPSRPLDEQLMAIGRQIAEAIMSDQFIRLARVVVSRFIGSPEIAAETLGSHDKRHQEFIRWIRDAKKDGRICVDNPVQASRQFAGLIKEFAFWPQLVGSEKQLTRRQMNQVVASATKMFLASYAC